MKDEDFFSEAAKVTPRYLLQSVMGRFNDLGFGDEFERDVLEGI